MQDVPVPAAVHKPRAGAYHPDPNHQFLTGSLRMSVENGAPGSGDDPQKSARITVFQPSFPTGFGGGLHKVDEAEMLQAQLVVLRRQHRDIDAEVEKLAADPSVDSLTLRRMKRKKLSLKDRIARIEDRLTPDIIA